MTATAAVPEGPHPHRLPGRLATAWAVYRKELADALRDRRTLATVFVSAVLVGPAALVAASALVASLEEKAERREVFVADAASAPSLAGFFARQTWTVRAPPADYEAALRDGRFGDAVVVAPADFETALVRGEAPRVEVVFDSANPRADASAARIGRLLAAFASERASLQLAMRGVAPQVLKPIEVDERDLASRESRAARIAAMLPYLVMMAVLYGALGAALDTTAGERERGSLEPLLMNPVGSGSIVFGKWAAVATLGLVIALLSSLSFLPAQALLRSDTLAAHFHYGAAEASRFLLVLVPYAAAMSALLMAVAIRCRSFKEAQASANLVVLASSLVPLLSIFNLGGEARWHLAVPALAQNVVMTRVLRGETLGVVHVVLPTLVCAALAVVSLVYVARVLRRSALA